MCHGIIAENQQETTVRKANMTLCGITGKTFLPNQEYTFTSRPRYTRIYWKLGGPLGVTENTKIAVVNDPTRAKSHFDEW
jgi:hypothetical protein